MPKACASTESRCWSCDEVKLVPASVNRKLIAAAVQTARKADVVVMVLGGNEQTSREGWADNHLGDRSSLDLVGQQEDLARAILALAQADRRRPAQRPPAVGQLPRRERAGAARRLVPRPGNRARASPTSLFGKVNPGGKLPVTIARSVGQLPVYLQPQADRAPRLSVRHDGAALPVRLWPQLHELRHFGPARV